MHVVRRETPPRFVINFPTKQPDVRVVLFEPAARQ